jgi:hypothetical protein
MEEINSDNVKYHTIDIPNRDGEPVDVYITGATVSQAEKRQPDTLGNGSGQYQGNDYFTSLSVILGRPVKVNESDKVGLIDLSKKIAWVQEFANNNNRKNQQAHGLVPKVSRDLQNYVKVNQSHSFDVSKVVEAGNEPSWLMTELANLSGNPMAATPVNAVTGDGNANDNTKAGAPDASAPKAATKQTRKPASKKANTKPEVT